MIFTNACPHNRRMIFIRFSHLRLFTTYKPEYDIQNAKCKTTRNRPRDSALRITVRLSLIYYYKLIVKANYDIHRLYS